MPTRATRDGIFKLLWSPGINSNESFPPASEPVLLNVYVPEAQFMVV
jgi:hypothetical protein